MFNDTRIGYILWITHVLAALSVGILLRARHAPDFEYSPRQVKQAFGGSISRIREKNRKNERTNVHSMGKVLTDAVKNSMEAVTIIGGLIIFFNVVVAVLEISGLPCDSLLGGIVAGLVEVSGGAGKISALKPDLFTVSGTAFIIAFGGLSIHAQTFHFTAGTGLKSRNYIFAKLLHAVIAAALTAVAFTLVQ
jgi:hypothetical protein